MIKNIFNNLLKSSIIKGTMILTLAGFLTRIIGFFFRIFLTGVIGAEGLGIYQLTFPVQIVCYSLCTLGFELSISKLVASSKKSSKDSAIYLICGLLISVSISLVIALAVYYNANYIATRLLFEERCAPLIKYISFSIPLASTHACICGYYLGLKKTNIPAVSQIVEQLFRVLSIYLIILIMSKSKKNITPSVAAIGAIVGEFFSTLYCLLHLKIKASFLSSISNKMSTFIKSASEILKLSIPLTLNKLMLSILQSIQSALIPSMLILYGLNSSNALSIYGIILGLVIPLIMFPSAIVNSLSTILLPAISEAESNNNTKKIQLTIEQSVSFCLIFGILCSAIFFRYGTNISLLLFHHDYGKYIKYLGILCPFIYISATLASTINGLGHTSIPFIHNGISTIIQILSIVFLIPRIGILGFILGQILSSVISSVSLYISMYRLIPFKTNMIKSCFIPIALLILLIYIFDSIFTLFVPLNSTMEFIISCIFICILYLYILLKQHIIDLNP